MLGFLDSNGFVIHINRVEHKRFELQENFQIIRKYKKRDSCNQYIKKLYNKIKAEQNGKSDKKNGTEGTKCSECRIDINNNNITFKKQSS